PTAPSPLSLHDALPIYAQRGRRYGLVLSPTDMAWSVVTIVPTSTKAQPAVFRPEIELGGVPTRFLVDQLRSIDARFVDGEPAFLDRKSTRLNSSHDQIS